jgi:hypothetical protein
MSHLRTAAFISSLGCLGLWACGPRDPAGQEPDAGVGDVDAAPRPDAEIWPDANPCELGVVCGTDCCRDDEVCAPGHEVCVPDMTCDSNDDCQNDSYCDPETSLCLPYDDGEVDETCTQINVVGVFAPDVQCEWLGPPAGDAYPGHLNVLATPVVVDFDFDGDGGTIEPSIIFPSYNGEDGGAGAAVGDAVSFGVIRVIDGSDCAQQHTLASPTVIAASPLAVADLDLAPDGRPEILAQKVGGGLVAFRYDPGLAGFTTLWLSDTAIGAGSSQWNGPSIYDLDGDGLPEVIQGASVFNGQTGVLLDGAMSLRYVKAGQIPVVADLYQDGKPELIAGDATWEWNAGTHTWVAATSGTGSNGLVAVADFGTYGEVAGADDRATLDGIPEVAVSASGSLRVQTIGGRVIHGPISITPGGGGPPTISDLDGDGRVEVGVASQAAYRVIDLDCVGPTPDPAACASERTDGILWSMATQDISSSYTGSSVFDFEGDGKAEVVYADECFSRVYDGESGDIVYSAYRTSCTWYENPIVADVDGDFNSEIVIPSNSNCGITCPTLDPQFDGLRCQTDAECPDATTCGFEVVGDEVGRCRCEVDEDCGGNGYVCRDPIAGPSPEGKVCRAGHPGVDQRGIRVVRDALDRWVNSRPIWNQHAYSVTHVEDGGVCLPTDAWEQNWTVPGLNNFRQAIAGDPDTVVSPDLTGGGADFACNEQTGQATITTEICNRGTEPVGAGIPISFYEGEPEDGEVLCTATTTAILAPGECEAIPCVWVDPPDGDQLIVSIVVDDGGEGDGESSECYEGNNRARLVGLGCMQID